MAKHTLGYRTLEDARAISPTFVAAVEKNKFVGGYDSYELAADGKIKRGTNLLILCHNSSPVDAPVHYKLSGELKDYVFKVVQVTSVKMNMIGEYDVRVRDDAYSWRTDASMVVI